VTESRSEAMRSTFSKSVQFILCTCLLLLMPGVRFADAQPGPVYVPCLDTMAVNSQFVFVGKIVEMCDPSRCAADSNVVVNVERRLKGEISDTIQARVSAQAATLLDWKNRSSRLLIFNGDETDVASGLEGAEKAIDLSDPNLKVLTASMQVLESPQQVLQATQSAIDRHPGVYRISTFMRTIPPETAGILGVKTTPSQPYIATTVPADSDLEHWAVSALDSRKDAERAQAASVLWRFASEANVERLKRLLADPVSSVRRSAFNSLTSIGVKVPEPAR
jgi:hypothetical protein